MTMEGQVSPWTTYAEDLAVWTWHRLVNRADVWGGYHPLAIRDKIVTHADGTRGPLGALTTRPAIADRGKRFLCLEDGTRHYHATAPEDIVGLHSTSSDNQSRSGAVDVDVHDKSTVSPEVTDAAAIAWYARLCTLGFRPLLTESNGRGGYHLRVIFNVAVPTPRVYAFLRWLIADHAPLGMPSAPEVFPKQARIEAGKYGNWLRLPGLHHTRPHWARVWDGSAWLDGPAAAEFILGIAGDDPALIPVQALVPKPAPPRPSGRPRPGDGDERLAKRILSYLAKLPTGLAEGTGRDDVAYHFAAFLSRDLALSDNCTLAWLEEWDRRQAVPKGNDRLQAILASVKRYGKRPIGCGRINHG